MKRLAMNLKKIGVWIPIAATLGAGAMFFAPNASAVEELIVGEARIKPGVVLIVEAAVRDEVKPAAQNLAENETDVHLEARANWDEKNIPQGAAPGSFVAYLNINAEITNESTGKKVFTTLIPHINLVDNFHYARNITLPGGKSDLYTVEISVNPPDPFTLATHRDWAVAYGNKLFAAKKFTYTKINFEGIVDAPPRQ
jgi:uncharacterized protein involved in high-affinity Fe2+ transport